VLRIAASRGFSELTKNVIRSSHGHSTPSLKVSSKSVQPFSRNLANKGTKKERYKQRNRSKTIPRPPMYRERRNGVIKRAIKLKTSPARLAQLLQPSLAFCFSLQPMTAHMFLRSTSSGGMSVVLHRGLLFAMVFAVLPAQ